MTDLNVHDFVPLFKHDERLRHVETDVAEQKGQLSELMHANRVEAPARHAELLQAVKDLRQEVRETKPNFVGWASAGIGFSILLAGIITTIATR